jgi:hypothetical protein
VHRALSFSDGLSERRGHSTQAVLETIEEVRRILREQVAGP